MTDDRTQRAVIIKPEPGTDAEPVTVYIKQEPGAAAAPTSYFRRQVLRQQEAARQHRAAFAGKVWFDDTVQTVNYETAREEPRTPTKREAYDGRFKALNVLKCDFLERREEWVVKTPFKDTINRRTGERFFPYTLNQAGIDLLFDGR